MNNQPVDILKTSEKFEKVDITKFSDELLEMYNNANGKYKTILENIFNEDVLEYSEADRPLPPYVAGFLDKPFLEGGVPTREKDLLVFNTILSGNYSTIEIEGGVRGGKDIIGLFAWSRYLQVCPELTHLALGSSLEHVLRTVLDSNGFGLFYTIPHGVFVRESRSGAQRGIYKFLDNYGREKSILFYGNEKENDGNKFQGFTIGSVYVNETLNQHLRGLEQAENRISSTKQPLMILTQNPKGKAHPFYQKFERAKLATKYQIEQIKDFVEKYKDDFLDLEARIKQDLKEEKIRIQKKFFKENSVTSYKALTKREQIWLNERLLNANFEFDKIIRNYSAQDFDKTITKGNYLFKKSVKKLINFFESEKNPNNVNNAYDFAYFHYTVDDNMSMTEMQINDFKNKRSPGTSVYEQEVEGKRRSTDSALFSMFTDENIFGGDIHDFDISNTDRVIAIDKGLNHPNGMIDVEIDFEKGEVYQLQENKLDVKSEDVEDLGLETIKLELLKLIRSRRNRQMPTAVLVDPSAIELKTYLRLQGFPVRDAINAVWSIKGDKEDSHQLQDKDLIGIPFVQTAIAKLKYKVHESNYNTIEQIGSYEAPFDSKTGKAKVKKINDEFPDCVRYVFNTFIRMSMWEGEYSSEKIKNDTDRVSRDEETKDDGRNLARQFAEAYLGEEYTESEQSEFSNFFEQGTGFFN